MLYSERYRCCMPDFMAAKEVINTYKSTFIDIPPEEFEEKFKRSCDMIWALDDLLSYMSENWFYDEPEEIIVDYIEEAKYMSEKYREYPMGPVYETAKETAEDILQYFIV